MTNYDGFMDGGWGCGFCAPPQPSCHGHKCRHNCGAGWTNDGYYAGCSSASWGCCGGFGGCGGCVPPPPPPQCLGHKCHRKHCAQNCSWANNGYPGWPAYPVPGANQWDDGYGAFTDPNCYGGGGKHCCPCCKHHHCFGHCRRGHCGHYRTPQYPSAAYPQVMPCFACDDFCSDCGFASEQPPAASSAPPKSK
jgi:hypothetical protein